VPFQQHSLDLDKLINNLENQQYQNFELILVSDSKITLHNQPTFNVKLLVCEDLPSKKRNLAASISKGKYLSFIDDDAYPDSEWLLNASKLIEKNKYLCFGGPGLLPKDSNFFEKSVQCYFENKLFNSFSERYSVEKPKPVNEWPTMNFFIDRNIFLEIGKFNENFWPGEDSELCIRLKLNNVDIYYDPNLIVFHRPRANLIKLSRQIFRYGLHRSYLMKQYISFSNLIFLVPILNIMIALFLIYLSIIINKLFISVYIFLVLSVSLISFLRFYKKNKLYSIFNYTFSILILTVIHFSYSVGMIKGFLTIPKKSKKNR